MSAVSLDLLCRASSCYNGRLMGRLTDWLGRRLVGTGTSTGRDPCLPKSSNMRAVSHFMNASSCPLGNE